MLKNRLITKACKLTRLKKGFNELLKYFDHARYKTQNTRPRTLHEGSPTLHELFNTMACQQ